MQTLISLKREPLRSIELDVAVAGCLVLDRRDLNGSVVSKLIYTYCHDFRLRMNSTVCRIANAGRVRSWCVRTQCILEFGIASYPASWNHLFSVRPILKLVVSWRILRWLLSQI